MKASTYDRLNDRIDQAGFADRRDELVSTLDGVVLEIGAGTGRNLARYRRASRLIALEPSEDYLTALRARANTAPVPVEVLPGTAESIALPDHSVDHVVTSLTLCSVTSLPDVVAQCRRVLRPGGTLEFLEHVRSDGLRGRFQDWLTPLQRRLVEGCHLNRNPIAAIEAAGLRVASVSTFAMPPGNPLIRIGLRGTATAP